MQYHMLYVESRKSFKVRRKKNYLPSAKQLHSANIFLCRVPDSYIRQTYFFAKCLVLPSVFLHRLPSAFILLSVFFAGLGKRLVCRVPEEMHSANIKTLANSAFPVVIYWSARPFYEIYTTGSLCFYIFAQVPISSCQMRFILLM